MGNAGTDNSSGFHKHQFRGLNPDLRSPMHHQIAIVFSRLHFLLTNDFKRRMTSKVVTISVKSDYRRTKVPVQAIGASCGLRNLE